MQIHELTQSKETQLTEVDLIGPNSVFNKLKAAKQAGFKLKDPNNAYQKALNQQYQQAAAKAAAGLRAQGYGATPAPAPASTTTPAQAPAQTVSIGGQTLNPSNPAHAQIIAQVQASQPQTTSTPVTPAPAVATRPNTAGAVRPGSAQAIMTQTEFNNALRQINLSRNQIDELAKQLQTNPAMTQALLKALGLAK